jgi:hypothetical protein
MAETGSTNWNRPAPKAFVWSGSQSCRLVEVSITKLIPAGPLRSKPNWPFVNAGAPAPLEAFITKAGDRIQIHERLSQGYRDEVNGLLICSLWIFPTKG